MMSPLFDSAFKFLLNNEGTTYTNHPLDRGGPTKFGVTLKAYSAHVGEALEPFDIEMLTETAAKEFYFARYWNPMRCPDYKSPIVSICLFDSGVLYGVGTASRIAQLAVSRCGATIKFDGILGDNSVAALNLVKGEELVKAFHRLLMERIDQIIKVTPEDEVFRKGWTNRAHRLLALSDDDYKLTGGIS